jgi:hypothetical protein
VKVLRHGILLKLKKELFEEFPELKEKRSEFTYKLVFYRNFKEFEKIIEKLKNGESMPILLWLYKEIKWRIYYSLIARALFPLLIILTLSSMDVIPLKKSW